MINATSNINFKHVYTSRFTQLSESQNKVVEDIKSKLGTERSRKKDFLIKAKNNDCVELSRVYCVENEGYGKHRHFSYVKEVPIGTYSEEMPFEFEDYKKVMKKNRKNTLNTLVLGFGLFGIVFGGLVASTTKKINTSTEKVMTIAKDSIQTLKKDSLQISKDSMRILK